MNRKQLTAAMEAGTPLAVASYVQRDHLPTCFKARVLAIGVERKFWRSDGRWGRSATAMDGVSYQRFDEPDAEPNIYRAANAVMTWAEYEATRERQAAAKRSSEERREYDRQIIEATAEALGMGHRGSSGLVLSPTECKALVARLGL